VFLKRGGIVVVLLAAGAVAAPAGAASTAANERAARADATALLARLALPAGATPSASEPAGDGSALAQPAVGPPLTTNVVDDHAWWIVPGAPADVLAYVYAHRPAGSARVLAGTGAGVAFTGFDRPAVAGVLPLRRTLVAVVALPGGSTGLRADAQVVWETARPASERIPAGIRRVRVSVSPPVRPPFTIASATRVRQIVAALDALPAAQPGVSSCPLDTGDRVRLAFYARHGPVRAVAVVDPGGCGGVQLKVDGKPQPALAGGSTLTGLLGRGA
jgi:hypothetical protein